MPRAKRKAEGLSPSTPHEVTAIHVEPERVARRAYELYLSRGGGDGRDFEDWIVAEQELIRGRSGDSGR
jgi:hypothetical protein